MTDQPLRGVGGLTAVDKVVLVLGAGSSISEMRAARQAGLEPPSDEGFLELAERQCPELFESVRESFYATWRGRPPYPHFLLDMEQLFTMTYARLRRVLAAQQRDGSDRDLLDQARRLYAQVIDLLAETLLSTTALDRPAQHLALLEQLHRAGLERLAVVSFNYDLLADRALMAARAEGWWTWDWRDGYGFAPEGVEPPETPSQVPLLKLHGSVNWYVPWQAEEGQPDAAAPIHVPDPGQGPVPWPQRLREASGGSVAPLMVPPIFEKVDLTTGSLLLPWQRAEQELADATLVIVWGYSLPAADYLVEYLFAEAARGAKFNLVVVNPDRDSLARLTYVCGHAWTQWFFDVAECLAWMEQGWG